MKFKIDNKVFESETVKLLKGYLAVAISTPIDILLEHPGDNAFGDYTTNVAMVLARQQNMSPVDAANEIKNILDKLINKAIVEKVEVAGGGYINFYLKNEYLVNRVDKGEIFKLGTGKTVVIDYSAPNIAKPFGIGHLRSTNIGQAIYNIYKILGWNCIGDNHLGDWGTQFGKMITAIKHWGPAEADFDKLTIADLEVLYVKFHDEAEKNQSLSDEGRDWFARLEKGDNEARRYWQLCVDISIKEFSRVYELLDVKIDYAHGESFYEKMLPVIIEEVKGRGITKVSDGALIVEFKDLPPAIIQKNDGATTYFTRDMATIKYRLGEWNPDLCIYEVGSEQTLHFQQVFGAATMMGWTNKMKLYHLPHGLIRWSTGKFSTRTGDTIHLQDMIDKSIEDATKIAGNSQVVKNLTTAEKEEMINKVAIGAIKFTDLSSDPKKDIIFDWERMMDLRGDSGPYLQYTYARCKSVLNKSKIEQKNEGDFNNEEQNLIRELFKLEEKIVEAAERYNPSIIAEYLLSVARKYNEFYGKYRIIDQPEEKQRLWLTAVTAKTLKLGLGLLGIETVEKM